MMNGFKLLADTNVIIGLESNQLVGGSLSELIRLSHSNGVELFIDDASYHDIDRDKDIQRRVITLSKLEKFQKLRSIPVPNDVELVESYGSIRNANDRSDVRLLIALERKAVDFLVTQDIGLHRRARKIGLGDRVFTVDEALQWLRQTFTRTDVKLPYVSEQKAYQVNRSDPIFESLRADYDGFDSWFDKCCKEHRDCWTLAIGNQLAGIVVIKTEDWAGANTSSRAEKILKVCTFKVRDEYRGEKFGEQLLKQVLWFAQRNGYDLVYLTAYPKQAFLVSLLKFYGFEITKQTDLGELYLEKRIWLNELPEVGPDILESNRLVYPRFYDGPFVQKFCVPIQPDYHRKLFPEIAKATEVPLFPGTTILESAGERIPGNTIRKVYICRAQTTQIRPGDIILFYMSKNLSYAFSQSITTLGIVEKVSLVRSLEELVRVTAKRSVFTELYLEALIKKTSTAIKAIDFLLIGHLDRPPKIDELLRLGVFNGKPPQSIKSLSEGAYGSLKQMFGPELR